MMKRITTFILANLLLAPLFAQSVVKESLTFKSNILQRDVKYSIYLPDGYATSQRSYPVLYLLHGYTDNETAWVVKGRANKIADESISKGDIVPFIIVMPDAWDTWYINRPDGTCNYENMFFEEFIPAIEKQYRIAAARETRAIAGLSMGGHGAFLYSLHYPELFSSCAPLSAAVMRNNALRQRAGARGQQETAPDAMDIKKNSGVLDILQGMEKSNGVRYYIDCGDDDFLLNNNMEASKLMRDHRIAHELRVRDGSHNWKYWQESLPEVLKFINKSFAK